MIYVSTRDKSAKEFFSTAVKMGISKDGGLFLPRSIPLLDETSIERLVAMDYKKRAVEILSLFISDFSIEEIEDCVNAAYTKQKFGSDEVAPIYKLGGSEYILELFHGPTSAFKDMALQILPKFLTYSMQKSGDQKTVVILVATSGDTGKAALEGFADVPGTKIVVFYPKSGVSEIQRLQMTTQSGENVMVGAVEGNFDDAQTGVKKIFADLILEEKLNRAGMAFSSANSINWGRLVPQIVYYVSSYCELLKNREISFGEQINVTVPTGNFGNILAAYYAKKMGVPIKTLICASNANDVLTEFIKTGVYNKNRAFLTTLSPSMDILVSSNLERLLFELSGGDDKEIVSLMEKLRTTGRYEVSEKIKKALGEIFYAGCCDDLKTKKTIKEVFEEKGYLVDTHTAVAISVYREYQNETKDETKTIIASTASPYKFGTAVLSALRGEEAVAGRDEFEILKELSELSDSPIPEGISGLLGKTERFDEAVEREKLSEFVSGYLGV